MYFVVFTVLQQCHLRAPSTSSSQQSWDDDSACWSRLERTSTDPQPFFTLVPEKAPLPFPKYGTFNETFKWAEMAGNNSHYCQVTSKRKVLQAIPQSQMGQIAILETEKGNSEKTGEKQHASNSCENCSLLLGNLLQLWHQSTQGRTLNCHHLS